LRLGSVVYLAVNIFIGMAAINSQTNLLFWVFGLMTGGLVASGLFSGSMLARVKVRRLLPDHGAVGEPLIIRYELQNAKRLVPCFGLIISEIDHDTAAATMPGRPHGWVLHVGPRATVLAEATGFPQRRGPLKFEHVRIATTFPFGILRKSITVPQPGRIVIYPRLHRLRREVLALSTARDPIGTRPSQQAGGSEEFYGLREYRHGDALRSIDWKHSARMNLLVSREMTRQTPPRLMVMLDLRSLAAGEDRLERAISFGASVICEAHRSGYEVGLTVAGMPCARFEVRHSRWHRTRILHALGELDLARHTGEGSYIDLRDVNWLVIHAGEADPGFGPPNARHVSDAALPEWTLGPGPASAPRRDGRSQAPATAPTTSDQREAALRWA
jgi:uncharacterized protein (DUF58 family)